MSNLEVWIAVGAVLASLLVLALIYGALDEEEPTR